MKFKVLICLLTAGFCLPLQAFSVKNMLSKTITVSNVAYSYGGGTRIPQGGTATVSAGMSWSSGQIDGSTGSFTASVGKQNFNISNLSTANVVTFSLDSHGNIQYSIA